VQSSIQRYARLQFQSDHDPQEGEADMDEAEDGWWVKFDDLAALVAAHKEGK